MNDKKKDKNTIPSATSITKPRDSMLALLQFLTKPQKSSQPQGTKAGRGSIL